MSELKEYIHSLSLRKIVLSLLAVLSLLLFLVLTLWCNHQIADLSDQQAAARWDNEGNAAQISCFISNEVEIDEFQIKSFEKQLETALQEAAITQEEAAGRLYVDAYSSQGKIKITSNLTSLEANAVGIGGDFFLFHPLVLVSGGYFSGNDLMKDSVILDEDAAWQLFGSNDIEGMSITIGGVPHYIAGVIKREEGRLAENAGLKGSLVFVSYETLSQYGSSEGISTYELIAPNPVKGFVYRIVKEKFGLQETQMMVIENSSRYSLESIVSVVLDFGIRSMQNAAIQYPYWENIARGYEDIKALVLVIQVILLLIPLVIIFSWSVIKWRNKSLCRGGKK